VSGAAGFSGLSPSSPELCSLAPSPYNGSTLPMPMPMPGDSDSEAATASCRDLEVPRKRAALVTSSRRTRVATVIDDGVAEAHSALGAGAAIMIPHSMRGASSRSADSSGPCSTS